MTFIHIADLHADRSRKEQCLKVLDTIYNFILSKKDKPYLMIAGDFWNTTIQNTENSGFTEFTSAIKKILEITKVFFIYGTPSHENSGSLEVFRHMGAYVYDTNTVADFDDFELIAIPEPRRSNYISNNSEETTEKINADNERFILGIGPKEKTRFVMYHGEIQGAVYQNNMSASSPIALSKKLLKSLDADYIAVGHIHEPQFLWDNCAYSGSCCPVNAGEHHDACFNFITVQDGKTSVEKISFGFPINVTEYALVSELDEIKRKDFTNKNVTLKLTLEKAIKKAFNQSQIEKEIKAATNANSVRLLFEYKAETNIRSKEIVNEKSIKEKFKIYCDLNDIKITEDTIDKLQDIQDNLLIDSFIPCDTFELESLQLRGAIGIKDGIGLDEINIDFTKYNPGVVALTGKNGSGKSTILENCHPFPRLLTRSGSLKDHFCLHDSHRILTYKTSTGKKIRIKMLIDGTKTSVLTRYFVETLDVDSDIWKPLRCVDGTSDSYKEWVENTFGTVDMFLRTSFYANKQVKGIPDLSMATKGEKMELFTHLAGTDYLTSISEAAKEKAKAAEDEMKDIKKDIKDYDNIKSKLEEDENIVSNNTILIDKENEQLAIDNDNLIDLEEKQRAFIEAIGSSNVLRKQLVEKRNNLKETEKTIESLKANIEQLEKDSEDIPFFKEQIEWWDNSIKEEDKLRKNKDALNEQIMKVAAAKTKYQLTDNQLNKELSAVREESIKLDGEIKVLYKSINEINDICPVCGEKLSEHKKEVLERENKEVEDKIQELISQKEVLSDDIGTIKDKIVLNKAEIDKVNNQLNELAEQVSEINADLTQLSDYRLTVDIEKAKHIVNNVATLLDQDAKELQKMFEAKKKLEDEIEEAEKEVANIPDDYSDKINKLKRAISNSRNNIADWIAEKKQAEKELTELKSKINLIKEVDDKLKGLNANFKDYSIISKAFSNNGIQALELDSAAPDISNTANQILSSTYGDRFTISFDTQRDSKDGRKIEDFVIKVFDSKSGREKRLDVLSGGETVWIKNALYYAFSVVRSRRSGFCFKTRFLDESDGTLDSDARIKYLNMIESAHRACNANLTILVTHSMEIKEIVDQKIELT